MQSLDTTTLGTAAVFNIRKETHLLAISTPGSAHCASWDGLYGSIHRIFSCKASQLRRYCQLQYVPKHNSSTQTNFSLGNCMGCSVDVTCCLRRLFISRSCTNLSRRPRGRMWPRQYDYLWHVLHSCRTTAKNGYLDWVWWSCLYPRWDFGYGIGHIHSSLSTWKVLYLVNLFITSHTRRGGTYYLRSMAVLLLDGAPSCGYGFWTPLSVQSSWPTTRQKAFFWELRRTARV